MRWIHIAGWVGNVIRCWDEPFAGGHFGIQVLKQILAFICFKDKQNVNLNPWFLSRSTAFQKQFLRTANLPANC